MKPALFSSRKIFLSTISVIIGVSLVGWLMWSLSSLQYRRIIDRWIAERRANGYQISFDDRQIFGFPRRITMRLNNLHWRDADDIDFVVDRMDITVTPWHWNDFDAKFKGHVMLQSPLDEQGHALVLSGAAGVIHVRLNKDGFWRTAKIGLEAARVGLAPSYLFSTDKLSASAERPEKTPTSHKEAGLTLAGQAEDVTAPEAMPAPFGPKASVLSVHMRVMGGIPDVRERASVDAWNKESGVVEFDDFSLQWGLLNLHSKGTLGFDDDLQPEGAFSGVIQDPAQAFGILMDKGFIVMHDANMISSLMAKFAKPEAGESDHGFRLPITVQLGGLFFGPVRLFTFPPIEWPLAPPAVPPVH